MNTRTTLKAGPKLPCMDHLCDTHHASGGAIMAFFPLSLWPVVLHYQLQVSLVLLDSLKTKFLLDELEAAETKTTLYLSGYWLFLKCYLIRFTWKGPPQPEVYRPSASSELSLHCNYCECNLLKQLMAASAKYCSLWTMLWCLYFNI